MEQRSQRGISMDNSMWKGSYGREPFDLRLTVLRMLRNLNEIILFTAVGALLFGGGYYVKNVLLRPTPDYEATSVYRVEYSVTEEKDVADVHINEMTWNTYVHTDLFLDAVMKHLEETGAVSDELQVNRQELGDTIQAFLASNLRVPSTTVTTKSAEKSIFIAGAVEKAMTEEFAASVSEVESISVIDHADTASEVLSNARPVRAFVLSALLSFFFAAVIFLLREIGGDGIWLPVTLRRRYGLQTVGTIKSPELRENIKYLFKDKKKVAVCATENLDVSAVIESLNDENDLEWTGMPSLLLCPEACETIRKADGLLLVVKAGNGAGRRLEYILELLAQQNCEITAAILWDADEKLLRAYYLLPKSREDSL